MSVHRPQSSQFGGPRSPEAEQAYNRRWLAGVVTGSLTAGLAAAVWMFMVADDLPDPLASHWSGGKVDGYLSLWGHASIAVFMGGGSGALMAGLAIVTRGHSRSLARLGVGAGLGFGLLLTGLAVAVVAGQLGLTDASKAAVSAPVLWSAAALAAVAAAAGAWWYRPGDVDRRQSAETSARAGEAADHGSAVGVQARTAAARDETLTIDVSMGRAKWLASLGTGAVVALSLFFILPALALLGIPAAVLLWVFCSGRVVVDPEGVRVLAGGFWKLMPLEYAELRAAAWVQDIQAMDFGGRGYRLGAGQVGFIMASGPALILETGFRQKVVISMPDAETAGRACALVNAYRERASEGAAERETRPPGARSGPAPGCTAG